MPCESQATEGLMEHRDGRSLGVAAVAPEPSDRLKGLLSSHALFMAPPAPVAFKILTCVNGGTRCKPETRRTSTDQPTSASCVSLLVMLYYVPGCRSDARDSYILL